MKTTNEKIINFINDIELNDSTIKDYNKIVLMIKDDNIINFINQQGVEVIDEIFDYFCKETFKAFNLYEFDIYKDIDNFEKNHKMFYSLLNTKIFNEVKKIQNNL